MTQALAGFSLEQRRALLARHWAGQCGMAREDVNVFVELVLRNDQDDAAPAAKQQWFHREWQAAWQREHISVIHGATGFGKSEQLIAHLLWRIGRNPKIRIAIIGKQQANAIKLAKKIKRQIEENATLRSIFTGLRPGEVWTDEKLRVAGAGIDNTTNTVETYGLDGSPQGLRADIIVLDDVIDFENTLTDHQRKKTIEFVDSVVQSRLTTHGQLHILANAWHPQDLAFTYGTRPGIWHGVYPAWDERGVLLWPDFRSRAWLDSKRATMSPTTFARMFLCQPRDEGTRIFRSEWFARARAMGAGLAPVERFEHAFDHDLRLLDFANIGDAGRLMERELRFIIGVDLATGVTEKKRQSDFTVFFVLGIDPQGRRRVSWIEKGRWDAGESARRMVSLEGRFKPVMFMVETNGGQKLFADLVRQMPGFKARIEAFVTTKEKWSDSEGVESIGIELQAGRWIIPSPTAALSPELAEAQANIDEWQAHLLDFARVGHTPDDVMAGYFAARGAVLLGAPVFSNDAAPDWDPLANWNRVAGISPTAAGLFPDQATTGDEPDISQVPAHVRAQFGVA